MSTRWGLAMVIAVGFAAAASLGLGLREGAASPTVRVYRAATCGCCKAWAQHLERDGFRVEVVDVRDLAERKARLGIPRGLAACHTAEVSGYLIEGHVPARDVRRLLRERPAVRGLAVPGMPQGSPGMEGPDPEPYVVWSFGADGVAPFARHGP